MPKVRIFVTDKQGNNTLVSTVDTVTNEVIHHASEEFRAEQRERNTERIKCAMEELAMRNPKAVLEMCSIE